MKNFTKLLTWILVCVIAMAMGVAATVGVQKIKAELRSDFTIEIDGEEKVFKNAQGDVVYPILYDGTTYLPVRAIGELMGKTVIWDETEKLVSLVEKKEPTVTDADIIIDDPKPEKPVNPEVKNEVDKEDVIDREDAKKTALEKAGLSEGEVRFEKVELDFDDGVWVYEVEFKKGNVEYDAEISAKDGKVLKWEVDRD